MSSFQTQEQRDFARKLKAYRKSHPTHKHFWAKPDGKGTGFALYGHWRDSTQKKEVDEEIASGLAEHEVHALCGASRVEGRTRPRGILGVSYSVNCGLCGMVSQHMPDPKIKNWKQLLASLTGSRFVGGGWHFTSRYGWVCGCEEWREKNEKKQQAVAKKEAELEKSDDRPF